MSVYYNEIDPFAAAWLRELMKAGEIPDGEVDTRSIVDVRPADLVGFRQCHFFAGIGGWAYALRLAGWPDEREVWTGSCPCQPFSSAGSGKGGADDRHLWPHWARLIRECRPLTIFGEQVESAVRHGWLDAVFDDLEREAYACGAVDLPAASVGAPHIRQRVWFVADRDREQRHSGQRTVSVVSESLELGALGFSELQRTERSAGDEGCAQPSASRNGQDQGSRQLQAGNSVAPDGMADTEHAERRPLTVDREYGRHGPDSGRQETHGESGACSEVLAVANANGRECRQGISEAEHAEEPITVRGVMGDPSGTGLQGRDGDHLCGTWRREEGRGIASASVWADAIWINCRDGKARPTQPSIFPLAYGVSNRVGTLRGAGNAIIPQVAEQVIRAYMEIANG